MKTKQERNLDMVQEIIDFIFRKGEITMANKDKRKREKKKPKKEKKKKGK